MYVLIRWNCNLQRKPMAQKRTQMMPNELADEDNDDDDDDADDYGLVSGKASIGLGGGRAMQSRVNMVMGSCIAVHLISFCHP